MWRYCPAILDAQIRGAKSIERIESEAQANINQNKGAVKKVKVFSQSSSQGRTNLTICLNTIARISVPLGPLYRCF